MPGLIPNLNDPAEKPWIVFEHIGDGVTEMAESVVIGLFYAATAEEAIALACKEEPMLTLVDPERLVAGLAWLIPMTPWEKQLLYLNMPDPPF